MEFILEYKWFFLISAEVVFWICAILFLIFRYWFKLDTLSKLLVVIFIVNDLWIAFLAYIDYQRTGVFSNYQIIILIIIIYALTFGNSDFKKLDVYIKRKVSEMKGEPLDQFEVSPKIYGLNYAVSQWKNFLLHLILFIILHLVFYLMFDLSEMFLNIPWESRFGSWFDKELSTTPFNNKNINKVSKVWLLVLIIDFAITCSYSIFPKKN